MHRLSAHSLPSVERSVYWLCKDLLFYVTHVFPLWDARGRKGNAAGTGISLQGIQEPLQHHLTTTLQALERAALPVLSDRYLGTSRASGTFQNRVYQQKHAPLSVLQQAEPDISCCYRLFLIRLQQVGISRDGLQAEASFLQLSVDDPLHASPRGRDEQRYLLRTIQSDLRFMEHMDRLLTIAHQTTHTKEVVGR